MDDSFSPLARGGLDLATFSRNILYEDNHLLALYKPAGMLTQGDSSGRLSLLDLGKAWLKETYHKPGEAFLGMVHRLDRPVSGVVLFAKTSKAASRLSEQFRNRAIHKVYMAVVHGCLDPPSGDSIAYLARHGRKSVPAPVPAPGTQRAEMAYETLTRGKGCSLVRITLLTGRRHQIRAQLALLGCPVLGDRRYGSPLILEAQSIALHGLSLTFSHPVAKDEITLEAPLPHDGLWTNLV